MIPYSSHHVATARHHEHLTAADQARLVRAARTRAGVTTTPGRRPFAWLREAAGSVAQRFMAVTKPPATSPRASH